MTSRSLSTGRERGETCEQREGSGSRRVAEEQQRQTAGPGKKHSISFPTIPTISFLLPDVLLRVEKNAEKNILKYRCTETTVKLINA